MLVFFGVIMLVVNAVANAVHRGRMKRILADTDRPELIETPPNVVAG